MSIGRDDGDKWQQRGGGERFQIVQERFPDRIDAKCGKRDISSEQNIFYLALETLRKFSRW